MQLAVVNVFHFDYDALCNSDFRLLRFASYDKDWLDMVVDGRKGGNQWQSYDIIEGGIANDRVIDTVEAYMEGDITAEQTIGQLRYHTPTHQIALLNQQVIDGYLKFERSYQINL